jgi:hypothetical protein
MQNLKDYRDKELRYYVITDMTFLLLLLDTFPQGANVQLHEQINSLSQILGIGVFTVFIYTFLFLADSLIPADTKQHLLFIKHLPGESIFTRIKSENIDKRFTSEIAQKTYCDIYTKIPKEEKDKYQYENSHWYAIYHKYRDVAMVFYSQRDWLLCRDIYSITVVFLVLYLLLVFVVQLIPFNWHFIIYLGIILISANIASRVKVKKYVYNVIAHDIAEINKKEE